MKAVVGLGNPGKKYEKTRHNVGFWVIDRLIDHLNPQLESDDSVASVYLSTWAGRDIVLAKPSTYMNVSGRAIRALQTRYNLAPDNILIVYDDLALQPGFLRMRAKGSSGGHNGVKSIINYLGTESFPRLRIGIGEVPRGKDQVDYVLEPPNRREAALIDEAVDAGAKAVLAWIEEGVERAMSRFNGNWGTQLP